MGNNQILIAGGPKTNKLTLLKEIFQVKDLQNYIDEDSENHSGIIVDNVKVHTKYYKTVIGAFVDEFNDSSIEAHQLWLADFRSEQMRELRDYIQGIIITMDLNMSLQDIRDIVSELETLSDQLDEEFLERSNDEDNFQWNGFKVVVGTTKLGYELDQDKLLEIEDLILGSGFEFIWYEDNRPANTDGDTFGKKRLLEIVENNEWRDLDLLKKMPTESKEAKDNQLVDTMTPLLSEDNENDPSTDPTQDLDRVINKLRQAKLNVSKINSRDSKEEYVNAVLNDIMKYI
ncbi:hypothetical protein CANARDRAFT_26500 [[Candida] arabinofermentans NRRL YB-2248]|uniref:Increased recombination centers protein 6 n=1 Tax=[Candida] arabinofermentans NRRL YB-2248 TaxID=983967 RepID=A0A1E4T5M8_9ASCO|nr:hypothetical protein CANARDRAFT_26500 [[Candida] arabinofermentans NRRL YB-2248]